MNDPRQIIANGAMGRLQITVVTLTVILNALDGFDVLAISFAAPGIVAEWGISRAQLGIVLSMELIGMSVGSVLIGGVADRFGRRPVLLGCLIVMASGMLMSTTASGVVELSVWRVYTGLGIGGMLAVLTATVAEFSNLRRRHLCVSLMAIGYPVGAVIGGTISTFLLTLFDWRSVFYFGAAATALFIPAVYLLIPESVDWLSRRQPAGALERINRTLRRMGHATVGALPQLTEETRKRSVTDIFSPVLLVTTLLVTFAYFFHITTFYFILKWVPQLVADMGFAAASAGSVLVWANVGGAIGGAVFGMLTLRVDVRVLTIGVMIISAVMVSLFGRSPADLQLLSVICAVAGFCTNAGIVGMYAIFAKAFPTHVRATGTGFAIGMGRGGSVLAPILAGVLLEGGLGIEGVAMIMGAGSLLAALCLFFLKLSPDRPEGEPSPAEADPAAMAAVIGPRRG